MIGRRFLLMGSLLTAFITSVEGQDRSTDPAQVRQEIYASWSAAETSIKTCRVIEVSQHYRTRDGKALSLFWTQTTRVVLTEDRYSFETFRTEPDPVGTKEVERLLSNSQYNATILKSKPTSAWTLKEHNPDKIETHSFRRDLILPWTRLLNVQLADLMNNPLISLVRAERPGGTIVRLHFVRTAGGDPVSESIRAGYIDFDEARYHCVVGSSIAMKSKFSEWLETCSCEYAPGAGVPVLSKAVFESPDIRSEKFGNHGSREVRTYDIAYNLVIPDDEFWLSHYGLPEPVGVIRERRTPRYLWFLAAGGVFVALAIGFRYLARRRSATAAAEKPHASPP